MTAQELINRIDSKNTDEEWLQLHKDIIAFLSENPSPEDKKKFVPLGYLETVSIICDGIMRKNNE